jgi:hypothetical protein
VITYQKGRAAAGPTTDPRPASAPYPLLNEMQSELPSVGDHEKGNS